MPRKRSNASLANSNRSGAGGCRQFVVSICCLVNLVSSAVEGIAETLFSASCWPCIVSMCCVLHCHLFSTVQLTVPLN
jgi:hypothetical protein